MYIRTLKLQSLRSHAETVLHLAPLTVIRGEHGAGKTSVLHAFELGLTNRCDLTDAAGRGGAAALIREGAKEMGVSLDIVINGATMLAQVSRTATGGSWIVGSASGKRAAEVIEKNIAPLPVLTAVLNASRIIRMEPNEQRTLLARALASEPVKLDPNSLLDGVCDGYVREVGDIDRLHKHFYDLRADANRDLKALGEAAKPERPEDVPEASIEDVKAQMAKIQTDLSGKQRERGRVVTEYETRSATFLAAETQKGQFEAEYLTNKQVAEFRKIVQNTSEAAKLDKKIADAQTGVLAGREQIALLDRKLANQQEFCQSCGQKLADVDTVKADIQKEIEALAAKVRDAEDDLKKLQARRAELGDPAHAQAKLDAHANAARFVLEAEKVLKQGAPQAPDTAAIDEEIATLEKRAATGRDVLQRVVEYEAQLKLYNERVERKGAMAKKANGYEQMVEYFGPKSPLRAQLIAGKQEEFGYRINSVLEEFGFDCGFDFDAELFEIRVTRINSKREAYGASLPLRALSESEQYRFAVAFSIALAEATGIRLAVFDRADVLLPGPRQELTGVLMKEIAEGRLDQAIVLAAGEPMSSYPEMEGVKFFEFSNHAGKTVAKEASNYVAAD